MCGQRVFLQQGRRSFWQVLARVNDETVQRPEIREEGRRIAVAVCTLELCGRHQIDQGPKRTESEITNIPASAISASLWNNR